MPRIDSSLARLLSTFLICAAAFLPVAGARSDEPHWLRVNSGHFSVVTDAEEKKGQDVVIRFEQMRSVFGLLLARNRINMSEPVDIIAFRSDEEYSKVVPNRQGPAIASGFFLPGQERNYFVLNLSKEDSWRAISRDFAAVFLNDNYPPTQSWFDEGFAEYFSSIRLDARQALIGADPESFTELLNAQEWLTIPDLFTKHLEPPAGKENSRHTLFYAESWVVMHYLLNQNKLSETGTYFDLVENQRLPVEQAIQKAYGVSATQLEQAVKDYFHSLPQPSPTAETVKKPGAGNAASTAGGTQLTGVAPADQIGSSTQELPLAEGGALVAEMSVRQPEHRDQALQELESIVAQPKGDNVVAHRALAWAHMEKKEFDRAIDELKKGAELNPKDPWLHFYLALVRSRAAQFSNRAIEGLPNMMQDLRLVLDWDPEFAEARAMLAMAQLEGGGVHAAMDSMRGAIQLSPRNQSYLLNMAQIYLAGKNWDAATALLERLKNGPDPQLAKAASEQLEGLPMLKKYGSVAQNAASPQPQETTSAPPASPPPLSSSAPSASPSTQGSSTSKKPTAGAQPKAGGQNPPPANNEEASADQPEQPVAPQPDRRTIQYVKGKLVAVDCSHAPSAILTVSAGAKLLKLRTEDYKSLTLIGADDFSCEWRSRTVSVNYRAGGKADGDLVSVELD
jgi:tetratricopeptide (TPR) repeat protein